MSAVPVFHMAPQPVALYYDPLAPSSQAVLMALDEMAAPFRAEVVHGLDRYASAAFRAMSPTGAAPVLRDERQHRTVLGITAIVEYVQQFYPGPHSVLPAEEPELLELRWWERLLERHAEPAARALAIGRAQSQTRASADLHSAYRVIERQLEGRAWALGSEFSLADCIAAAVLRRCRAVEPIPAAHTRLSAYVTRLLARPSFDRIQRDAERWAQIRGLPAPNGAAPEVREEALETAPGEGLARRAGA